MPTLHIPRRCPAHFEANIEAAAQQGRTPQELVEQVLTAHIEAEFPAPETFSEAQIARFQQSIAQLDRGPRIPAEQIEARFEAFFKRQAAR